jgi:hypothetical protein
LSDTDRNVSAETSHFYGFSGLTLTNFQRKFRQPKANFATAKFGLKIASNKKPRIFGAFILIVWPEIIVRPSLI